MIENRWLRLRTILFGVDRFPLTLIPLSFSLVAQTTLSSRLLEGKAYLEIEVLRSRDMKCSGGRKSIETNIL